MCPLAVHTEHENNGEYAVYRPSNIMITGGAGFIASHVAILLANKYPRYKVGEVPRWSKIATSKVPRYIRSIAIH